MTSEERRVKWLIERETEKEGRKEKNVEVG